MANLPDKAILDIEAFFCYSFQNKALLTKAFTHSSYANVHGCPSNERLEFLGNSVLDLICAEYLFHATKTDEGRLTEMKAAVVKETPLNKIILEHGMVSYLLTCGNVKDSISRSKVPSDLFEAVVGAIYLDGGYEKAKQVVLRLLGDDLKNSIANQNKNANQNHKGVLQEYLQARVRSGNAKELGLHYATVEKDGAFYAEAIYESKIIGIGSGKTKQSAEQAAAKAAYETLTKAR